MYYAFNFLIYQFYQLNHFSITQSGAPYELNEDLTGKTFIVTGATSGIGRSTCEELSKHNARIIMACRFVIFAILYYLIDYAEKDMINYYL